MSKTTFLLLYICRKLNDINSVNYLRNMKNLIIIATLLIGLQSFAQVAPDKYYVQFTDKINSPYSIDQPEDFLTQRALDRRTTQGIAIVENDIPVNPQYIQGVTDQGAEILNATRWLNGVTIYTTSSSVLDAILDLPYVENVRALLDMNPGIKKSFFEEEMYGDELYETVTRSADALDYGMADFQISQINGKPLHDEGYRGEGMVIAVLDGGFSGADVHPVFDSLWNNNQILGTKSFVNVGGSVFIESGHGKSVLSCMGANDPGVMIGTAPKASYWLLHSEDVKSENLIEEYNWVSAAEFADSVGADVINSSLSYVVFDDPQWDHIYDDLDGNTAVATFGGDIAASKGILVCNSAGNSGNSSFPWNGAPADGDSVLSVGSVRDNNQRSGFSSIGPTADGRIRPVTMALGSDATVAYENSGVGTGSGTSFSSPIIAGMSTCLWQANPTMKVMDIYEAIKESGSQSNNPDNQMGWGIPDYALANSILTTVENQDIAKLELVTVWPNPFTRSLNIKFNIKTAREVKVELRNIEGTLLYLGDLQISEIGQLTDLGWDWENLPAGIYILLVKTSDGVDVERLIKQ